MNYRIIQPPFTLVFKEMSKAELREYASWFHGVMPERIDMLTAAVKSTKGYEAWSADFSPDSLDALGEWFAGQVETRQRKPSEINEIRQRSEHPFVVPEVELTNKTFSMAIDVGMYLSEVFRANHSSLEWSQGFGRKDSINYGQPVLSGFADDVFNPVHMIVTLAYGISRGRKGGGDLRRLRDIWVGLIAP